MKLNYLILAHHNFRQLDRMIQALDFDHARFYVHIDGRVNVADIGDCKFLHQERVHVIAAREHVKWGGYNMVKATLNLMKCAIASGEKGYMALMSGQDFPIRSPLEIYHYLSQHYGNEYLEFFSLPYAGWEMNGGMDRVEYFWNVDRLSELQSDYQYEVQRRSGKKRAFLKGMIPYAGSQWWALTAECCHYLLELTAREKMFEQYFRHSYIPDEMFFQMLILNSPFRGKIINDNLKYIDWSEKRHNPKTFLEADFTAVMQSGKLWARKFNEIIDGSIISRIEEAISNVNSLEKISK